MIVLLSFLGVGPAKLVANAAHHKQQSKNQTQHIPILPYFAGVTLSGMDFAAHPSQVISKSASDAPFTIPSFDQAMHYLEDRHLNLVKLPLAWESIQQSIVNKTYNLTTLETYTDVVATVTNQNASVILTLSISGERFDTFYHDPNESSRQGSNHAGNVTHKGSAKHKEDQTANTNLAEDATNVAFLDLWEKLAFRFKNHRRVIFHLMEIPHGSRIASMKLNKTIQDAVTKIRNTGAMNVIILPSFAPPETSTTYNTFRDFPKYFENMKKVTNPDGTTHGIVFDLSLTLGPRSNRSEHCGGVNATLIVEPVVKLLREQKRQAIVGTLAAGSEDSCTRSLFRAAKEISSSYPHLAGFVLYGAGAYPENQPWSLIKEGEFSDTKCSEVWIDQPNFRSVMPLLSKNISASNHSIDLLNTV